MEQTNKTSLYQLIRATCRPYYTFGSNRKFEISDKSGYGWFNYSAELVEKEYADFTEYITKFESSLKRSDKSGFAFAFIRKDNHFAVIKQFSITEPGGRHAPKNAHFLIGRLPSELLPLPYRFCDSKLPCWEDSENAVFFSETTSSKRLGTASMPYSEDRPSEPSKPLFMNEFGKKILAFVFEQLSTDYTGQRKTLLIREKTENIVEWIKAISSIMPENCAMNLTFSTNITDIDQDRLKFTHSNPNNFYIIAGIHPNDDSCKNLEHSHSSLYIVADPSVPEQFKFDSELLKTKFFKTYLYDELHRNYREEIWAKNNLTPLQAVAGYDLYCERYEIAAKVLGKDKPIEERYRYALGKVNQANTNTADANSVKILSGQFWDIFRKGDDILEKDLEKNLVLFTALHEWFKKHDQQYDSDINKRLVEYFNGFINKLKQTSELISPQKIIAMTGIIKAEKLSVDIINELLEAYIDKATFENIKNLFNIADEDIKQKTAKAIIEKNETVINRIPNTPDIDFCINNIYKTYFEKQKNDSSSDRYLSLVAARFKDVKTFNDLCAAIGAISKPQAESIIKASLDEKLKEAKYDDIDDILMSVKTARDIFFEKCDIPDKFIEKHEDRLLNNFKIYYEKKGSLAGKANTTLKSILTNYKKSDDSKSKDKFLRKSAEIKNWDPGLYIVSLFENLYTEWTGSDPDFSDLNLYDTYQNLFKDDFERWIIPILRKSLSDFISKVEKLKNLEGINLKNLFSGLDKDKRIWLANEIMPSRNILDKLKDLFHLGVFVMLFAALWYAGIIRFHNPIKPDMPVVATNTAEENVQNKNIEQNPQGDTDTDSMAGEIPGSSQATPESQVSVNKEEPKNAEETPVEKPDPQNLVNPNKKDTGKNKNAGGDKKGNRKTQTTKKAKSKKQ